MQFSENEAAALFHFKHAEVGDDEVDDSQAGDWQRAFFQNLRTAVLRSMFHHDDNALHSCDKVHGSAWSFDHFPGHHPVCDIAFVRHFERTENCQIDMSAANHRE